MGELFRAELDYLLFCLLALAGFVVLAWLLPRRKNRARLPNAAWPVLIALLTILWVPVERAGRDERREIDQFLQTFALTYASELMRIGHAALPTESKVTDPNFQAVLERQRDWLKTNHSISRARTIRQAKPSEHVVVVDSALLDQEKTEPTAIPGSILEEVDPALAQDYGRALAEGLPRTTGRPPGPVLGWAPLLAPDGKVEALLAVEFDSAQYVERIGNARLQRIGIVAFLLAAFGASVTAVALLRADIHQRLLIEEELRRSRERLMLHIQQAPLAVIELNTDAEVIDWNPAAEKIFGHRRDEILGRPLLPLVVPPDVRSQVDQIWEGLLRNTGGIHSVNENVTKDGRTITCEWFNTRIVDKSGQIIGVLSLAQDVTDRRELEAQLQQSQKMNSIGQLAAGIAHDFNNILTIVQGNLELLLPRRDLPPDAISDLQAVAKAADRAANLTRQLLSFGRKQIMLVKVVDLNATVAGITTMLTRLLGERITVECHLAPRLPMIEADPSLVEQVVMNLALNARDAMPCGGTLRVATRFADVEAEEARLSPDGVPGPHVVLEVRDTGVGIPEEMLSKIFEPFFTTKEVGTGPGLGLSAVHGIVRQHKGWIKVTSEEGKGTTMEVFIPASRRQSPLPTENGKHPAIGNSISILLVEDEDPVRRLAKNVLERQGYRVIDAADGPSAVKLWKENRNEISLLVTDLVMPNGMTGTELARELRADKPTLKVVYASGYSVDIAAPDFCQTRSEVFIGKPYLPRQLLETVRQLTTSDV